MVDLRSVPASVVLERQMVKHVPTQLPRWGAAGWADGGDQNRAPMPDRQGIQDAKAARLAERSATRFLRDRSHTEPDTSHRGRLNRLRVRPAGSRGSAGARST